MHGMAPPLTSTVSRSTTTASKAALAYGTGLSAAAVKALSVRIADLSHWSPDELTPGAKANAPGIHMRFTHVVRRWSTGVIYETKSLSMEFIFCLTKYLIRYHKIIL